MSLTRPLRPIVPGIAESPGVPATRRLARAASPGRRWIGKGPVMRSASASFSRALAWYRSALMVPSGFLSCAAISLMPNPA